MKAIIPKVYHYAFALLLIIFPFSKALPNIILPVLAVLFIADYKNADFKRLLKGPIVLLYIMLIYLFIKAAINQSLVPEFSVYKKYLILFILPVLFLNIKNVVFFKTALVISINATIIASLGLSLYYYMQHGELPFNTGETVNKLLILERPYAGFYALTGVVLSLSLIKALPRFKWALIASSALAVFFIAFVAARMSFLTLLIIVGIYLFFYAAIPLKVKLLVTGGGLLAILALFMLNKNMTDRFFINKSLETASDYEPRIVIWPCAYSMTNDEEYNWLVGFSSNKIVDDNYVACYDSKIVNNPSKKEWFVTTRFNSHNQFNDYLLAHGLTGLLLLAGLMLYWLYYVKNTFAYAAITLALILFLAVENIFFRQIGCYFFSIFAALLLMTNNQVNDKN